MTITRLARGTWLAALLVVLVGGTLTFAVTRPGTAPQEAAAAGSFLETFDGAPGSPQPFVSNTVAVTRTERNLPGDTLQPAHQSMHGPDCAGPPATFTNDGSRAMAAYRCRDHVMTSIAGTPYGLVYLTPAALADWSAGSATISWSQSTARSSARDFLSVWITPWANVLDVPAPRAVDNDLNGAPLNAIHVELDFFTDRITPEAYVNGVLRYYDESNVKPYTAVVTPDNARRDAFELTVTASSVVLRLNGSVIARGDGVAVPFTSGLVQFGHHSYAPGKGCTDQAGVVNRCVNGDDIASANTWHWDNFSISPALPASFLQGAPDYSVGGHVSLNGAAQSGSRLRFNAIGRVELSWDGGRSWAVAPVQPGNQERDELHVASYWVPTPPGATGFDIRLSVDGPYPREMLHAKDFTVWAAAPGAGAPPPQAAAPPAGSSGGSGSIVTGSIPAAGGGFGLFVFAGGSNEQLLAASGCPRGTAAFWATNAAGGFDVYIPGAAVAVLNAAWNQRFAGGIPASTPLIGRC